MYYISSFEIGHYINHNFLIINMDKYQYLYIYYLYKLNMISLLLFIYLPIEKEDFYKILI